ncbi:serine/arginine-rich splicing factor 11-like [Homo sapiens]|uniref:serine/arginine-rich splicing factor 11-like n=1 Tax=Homo sapiens TaxID=9606 RepID=UPI0003EAFA8A|nr:serine/arginine-rich splicing factor 11-like [Homo sapiens]
MSARSPPPPRDPGASIPVPTMHPPHKSCPSPGPRTPYLQGPYLLLGEAVGHSALGAQPVQAAEGDADELLELPALLQRPAGRGPCATLRSHPITPAPALLLLSHSLPAQRRSMQATVAKAGSPGRGRLGKEPRRRESWTRSAPRRCPYQDASRAGSRVCRSRPQNRGGGDKKPRRRGQKGTVAGAKSCKKHGCGGKKQQKAAAAGGKSRGGKKQRERGQKNTESRGGEGKEPRRQGAKSCKKQRRQKAAAAGAKKPRRREAKSRGGGGGKKLQKAAAAGTKS